VDRGRVFTTHPHRANHKCGGPIHPIAANQWPKSGCRRRGHQRREVSEKSLRRQLRRRPHTRSKVRIAAIDDRDHLAQHEVGLDRQRRFSAVNDCPPEDLGGGLLLFGGQQLKRHHAGRKDAAGGRLTDLRRQAFRY
jgi:hypothetical protein